MDAAEADGYNTLQECILLGMYTGMRLNEICDLKLTQFGPDWIQVFDDEKDAAVRRIPIQTDIK